MTNIEGTTAPEGGGDDVRDDFAATIAALKPECDRVRAQVEEWNKRVAAYREQAGVDAELPADAFQHHPAYGCLRALYGVLFPSGDADELDASAACALGKLGRDDDGAITFNGGGQDHVAATADSLRRVARMAMQDGKVAMAAGYDRNAELFDMLGMLLFEDAVGFTPLAVAIREAAV